MHPLFSEALVEAHRLDRERAARVFRDTHMPRARRRRPPARVAVGMRLIHVGLRLVDVTPASPAC